MSCIRKWRIVRILVLILGQEHTANQEHGRRENYGMVAGFTDLFTRN